MDFYLNLDDTWVISFLGQACGFPIWISLTLKLALWFLDLDKFNL